jgi:hypothetical protein
LHARLSGVEHLGHVDVLQRDIHVVMKRKIQLLFFKLKALQLRL